MSAAMLSYRVSTSLNTGGATYYINRGRPRLPPPLVPSSHIYKTSLLSINHICTSAHFSRRTTLHKQKLRTSKDANMPLVVPQQEPGNKNDEWQNKLVGKTLHDDESNETVRYLSQLPCPLPQQSTVLTRDSPTTDLQQERAARGAPHHHAHHQSDA